MLKKLTERRWLAWLLVATVWALACVFLGRWQWHRWEEKSVIQDRISTNYDAQPVAVDTLMTATRKPAAGDEWRQVEMTGTYQPTTLMVRNRPGPDGEFGYQTLNVLDVNGRHVVVDRGWVPNGSSARAPQSVPAPPKGTVTVIGWVRPSEKSLGRADVPGQVASISVQDVADVTKQSVDAGYVRMRSERLPDGSSPQRPIALERPSQGQAAGINLSYAIQWWLGGIAGYAFVVLRARRELLDERYGAEHPHSDGGAEGPSDVSTAAPAARTKREPKPKKKRIWDEEDE